MWDLRVAFPFGRLSTRNIFVFAAAMIVATFAYILLAAPVAHAANAEWVGGEITYNDQKYIKQNDVKKDDGTGLPAGTQVYAFTEPGTADGASQKIHVIYFASGTDPTKEKSATYVTYDFTPPSTWKNPSGKQTIALTPQTAASQKTTSCQVEGVGWFICPMTTFLSGAMDWLFDALSSFMTVRPVQTDQENTLFRAWSYMRNFANVAFVIAFLVIIYSQISNIGISTYHIKKMLPRLVVAAILVNISYWICAIAIDISNIFGYSIQDIFISIRNNLVGAEGNNWDTMSWKSMSGLVLTGGVGATAAVIGGHALLAGTVSGAIYMLLPILLGVLIAALVALLVLAGRQAIITILVIISPLAFVAYVLPNTEKYFKKWHELGTTMLVMFPAFSVVFGGAQLAGTAIIQNADSINLVILGMAVQIAPVAITPLLLRLSGSLLTRVAGMVNNPNKGILDRTRNWAQERASQQKSRVLANPASNKKRDFLTRRSQSIDMKDRDRKKWQQTNDARTEGLWANRHQAHAIHQASEEAKMLKETGEATAQAAVERLRTTSNHRVQIQDVNLRLAKLDVDVAKAEGDVQWENLRAKETATNVIPRHLEMQARQAQAHTLGAAVVASQMHAAQHEQQQDFANALLKNDDSIQERAGGITAHGADSALASAITAQRKAYGESVSEAHQIIKHLNLSGAQRQDLAMGKKVKIKDANGAVIKTFDEDSIYAREAAIEAQMKGAGNYLQIKEIIENSGDSLKKFKTTISSEIVNNRLAEKAAYLGGKTIDEVAQGKIKGPSDLDVSVARTIEQGKIKPTQLATMDKDAIDHVLQVAKVGRTADTDRAGINAADYARQIRQLKTSANEALTSTTLMGNVAQGAKPLLERIRDL